MCGIFGVVQTSEGVDSKDIQDLFETLFVNSEARGKESCGAALTKNLQVNVCKKHRDF